jgi:hypothetical protein
MTVDENEDDFGQNEVKGNGNENENGNGNDQDHEIDEEEALEEALELDTQSQIFLEMRRQNLDLLKIAAEVSGYTGQHPPLRSGDLKNAMKTIWDVYSEFYAWIDPEESDEDEDEDDDL